MTAAPRMSQPTTLAKPRLTVFVVGPRYDQTIDALREALDLPRWVGGWPPHGWHIKVGRQWSLANAAAIAARVRLEVTSRMKRSAGGAIVSRAIAPA